MKVSALMQFAFGLILGATLSFLVGCIYAYCIWHPPSNDWGNEKVIWTLLCAPFVLIVLLVMLAKFRYVGRVAAQAVAIGRLGLAAVLIGGLFLPIVQLSESIAERNASALEIPLERAKLIAELGDSGSRLRMADAVIVETGSVLDQRELNRFLMRLAAFTSKPVFITVYAAAKPQISLDRSRASGTSDCSKDDACVIRTNSPDLRDWPTQGDVINIAEYYPSQGVILEFGRFKRASDEPPIDYSPHFPFLPGSLTAVRQWCQAEQLGPFPFGRGIHWHVCTDRMTLEDIGNGMFAPG